MKKNCKGIGKLKLTDIFEMDRANITIFNNDLEDAIALAWYVKLLQRWTNDK